VPKPSAEIASLFLLLSNTPTLVARRLVDHRAKLHVVILALVPTRFHRRITIAIQWLPLSVKQSS